MFGKFRGQPRGVFVMFATEFWERFSYYGFMGIMVLFMVADLNAGGLGYDRSRALFLFGLFSSFMWFMPLLGGWLADKFLGPRLAVLLGCIGLAGGNFLLAASSFAAKGGEVQTAMVFFVTGIVTMIAGAGLFKSNASALLGQLFGPNDPRREVGFILFYMGINMGARRRNCRRADRLGLGFPAGGRRHGDRLFDLRLPGPPRLSSNCCNA